MKNISELIKNHSPHFYRWVKTIFKDNKIAHSYLFVAPSRYNLDLETSFFIEKLFNFHNKNFSDYLNWNEIRKELNFKIIGSENGKIKKEDIINAINDFNETSIGKSKVKILLIKNIENANKYSLNALLKFIEEPTKNSFIIMTTNAFPQVLPTIKSRSQTFFINPIELKLLLKNSSIPENLFYLLSKISTSITEAKDLLKKFDLQKITDQVSNALRFSLRSPKNLIYLLFNKINENNYRIYFGILKIFYLSFLKKNMEYLKLPISEKKEAFLEFLTKKINYRQILFSIDDFIFSQSYNVNFKLYLMKTLIEIVRCYQNG